MQFKRNRHSVYKLTYHLVVVTKYRHPVINNQIKKRLEEVAYNLFNRWNCEILEINGEEDYLHILFDAPPQINLANTINSFKTVTSRYRSEEHTSELQSSGLLLFSLHLDINKTTNIINKLYD